MKKTGKLAVSAAVAASAIIISIMLIPPQWYSDNLRMRLGEWFGAPEYRLPESASTTLELNPDETEEACPEDLAGWRNEAVIEQVTIAAVPGCKADNPYAVAAFVRGTNNVSEQTLMRSGLTPDAVVKGRDLDGDGDPDEIHIRLEVVELNGGSPESGEPVVQYSIAPGVTPGLWVFAPKMLGMATENFESNRAREMLRSPSPTIRVEEGDRVFITLENSHYMPHTMHFHGVDHPFLDGNGEGNDGVPITSEMPVQPGQARTYEMQPRQPGTMFYHCHVQVQVHVLMGLQGMFVVEENRPNNWLQTMNIGAGQVRASSRAVREEYDSEHDLHYTNLYSELNSRVQQSNDAEAITHSVNRLFNITEASSDYFLLNGRSFPYTFQESLVVVRPDQRSKLRVVNGGSTGIALHTHGHKVTATHFDGVELNSASRIIRDVFWIASAQRVDLELDTRNDGLHSYGSGVWLLHDHQEQGVTNDGIGPGGNVGAIVYEEFLDESGWPTMYGEDWSQFFNPGYYRRPVPGGGEVISSGMLLRLIALGMALGVAAASLTTLFRVAFKNR
ncbi:MAG: multicopper oxidase domain-containing protein [Pseudohongiellaceae bacterium]